MKKYDNWLDLRAPYFGYNRAPLLKHYRNYIYIVMFASYEL